MSITTVTVDPSSSSWVDSGVVVPAGQGLLINATGRVRIRNSGNRPVIYPEGWYDTFSPYDPPIDGTYRPWAISKGDTGLATGFWSTLNGNPGFACFGVYEYGLVALILPDGSAAPHTLPTPNESDSVHGAFHTWRTNQLRPDQVNGGAGGRVWLLFNDVDPARQNTGSFTVTLEPLLPASFANGWQRTASAAMQAFLQTDTLMLATCVRVERRDGVVFGFTSHDEDVPLNGERYEANSSIQASALRQEMGNGIDNLDVFGMLQSDHITEHDLRMGLYDGARIRIMVCNWADTTMGFVTLLDGVLGMVTLTDGKYQCEVRSLMQFMAQQIGELTSPTCRVAHFGDARCKLNVSDWTAQGTIYTLMGDPYTLSVDVLISKAEFGRTDAFTDGLLTFLHCGGSGPTNEGLTFVIKSDISGNIFAGPTIVANHTLTLQEPMPYPIGEFDQVQLQMGCNRLRATCSGTFNNIVNFRGEPDVPGTDLLMQRGR